jgi:hypothetical protein
MTYEVKYRQMEIPELDLFLEEYRALCEKHGVQFSSEDYGYDGGHYMTIEKYTDGSFHLNLDKAGRGIPFMDRVSEEAERLNNVKYEADRQREMAERDAQRAAAEKAAISNGIVLSGKKYKLVAE